MMNRLFLYLSPLLLLMFCDKEPQLVGDPPIDNLKTIDTLTTTAYSIEVDASESLNETFKPLGNLNSTSFGNSSASIFSQVLLTITSFEPGANAQLDSAFIDIVIDGKYGPMTQAMTINVYELTEKIDINNTYTTESSLSYDNTIIGTTSYTYSSDDEIIRIPLNTAFSNNLFNQLGTSVTQTNSNFMDFLNGLYVATDASSGGDGMVYLNLNDAKTGLKLYFSSDTPSDSVYRFSMNSQALKVNKFTHDLTGSDVQTAFDDATIDDNELFISGLGISKAKITLPDLSFLNGALINQATLRFAQTDYSSSSGYDVPAFLFLYGEINNDTLPYYVTDYSPNNPTSYGGIAKLEDINGTTTNTYTYSIPRFIQRVVNQETEIDYLVIELPNENLANRVKLGGGSHPDFPIELKILYSN